jgi:hypothetical protein
MRKKNPLQPIQIKMLDVLSDGLPHSRKELHACLSDPMVDMAAIRVHICHIRKVLRPRGQDIVCELKHRKIHYRHVRLLLDPGED